MVLGGGPTATLHEGQGLTPASLALPAVAHHAHMVRPSLHPSPSPIRNDRPCRHSRERESVCHARHASDAYLRHATISIHANQQNQFLAPHQLAFQCPGERLAAISRPNLVSVTGCARTAGGLEAVIATILNETSIDGGGNREIPCPQAEALCLCPRPASLEG